MTAAWILVADDDNPLRKVIARILRKRGYQVVEANNGLEAVLAVQARAFDLVLLDVMMPGMDGAEAAREILAMRPSVRIAFVSGYPPSTAPIATAVFIAKPFTPESLADGVRRALATG